MGRRGNGWRGALRARFVGPGAVVNPPRCLGSFLADHRASLRWWRLRALAACGISMLLGASGRTCPGPHCSPSQSALVLLPPARFAKHFSVSACPEPLERAWCLKSSEEAYGRVRGRKSLENSGCHWGLLNPSGGSMRPMGVGACRVATLPGQALDAWRKILMRGKKGDICRVKKRRAQAPGPRCAGPVPVLPPT